MKRIYVIGTAALCCMLLASCAGGPPRFKVPRDAFDRQVHTIAISPCDCMISAPDIFMGVDDPAKYQDMICATTESWLQLSLTSSSRYRIIGAEQCRAVKDSVIRELAPPNGRSSDSTEIGLTVKQLFSKRYLERLGGDATLLVYYSTIGDTKNNISSYTKHGSNEMGAYIETGHTISSEEITHIILAARLVGSNGKTFWNNSVMFKRKLDPSDRAKDIFSQDQIKNAVSSLLRDFRK